MALAERPGVTASARLEQLRELLATQGMISSRQAAAQLGCSLETIRKDLVTLENQGHLRRAHGGALPTTILAEETPLADRTSNAEEKKRIAKAALEEIATGSTVFLESGTTTHQVALMIPDYWKLTVFTNSLPIAASLVSLPLVTTHLMGGTLRPLTQGTTGYWALRELRELRVDTAVLGTNAISDSGELSTPDSDEAALKSQALTVASRTIVLADHSKFHQRAVFQYGTLEDVDLLITDSGSKNAVTALSPSTPRTSRYA